MPTLCDLLDIPTPEKWDGTSFAAAALQMSYLLEDCTHEELGRHGTGPDPMQAVVETGPWNYVQLDNWLARLRQLGRDKDAEALEDWLKTGDWTSR